MVRQRTWKGMAKLARKFGTKHTISCARDRIRVQHSHYVSEQRTAVQYGQRPKRLEDEMVNLKPTHWQPGKDKQKINLGFKNGT